MNKKKMKIIINLKHKNKKMKSLNQINWMKESKQRIMLK